MQQSGSRQPRVGVGVLLTRGDCVLVGLRKGSYGAGTWALPGGHLDFAESWEACALRETEEETGLRATGARHIATFNVIDEAEGMHYVTLIMRCDVSEGQQAATLEPHKCGGWKWVTWPGEVPQPVFPSLQRLIDAGYSLDDATADAAVERWSAFDARVANE
jgi:8-oxo-dGTP diphosphatase